MAAKHSLPNRRMPASCWWAWWDLSYPYLITPPLLLRPRLRSSAALEVGGGFHYDHDSLLLQAKLWSSMEGIEKAERVVFSYRIRSTLTAKAEQREEARVAGQIVASDGGSPRHQGIRMWRTR